MYYVAFFAGCWVGMMLIAAFLWGVYLAVYTDERDL